MAVTAVAAAAVAERAALVRTLSGLENKECNLDVCKYEWFVALEVSCVAGDWEVRGSIPAHFLWAPCLKPRLPSNKERIPPLYACEPYSTVHRTN